MKFEQSDQFASRKITAQVSQFVSYYVQVMQFFPWLCSYVDIIVFIIEYGTYKETLLKNILANNKLGHKTCVFRSTPVHIIHFQGMVY